jgi:hypothetical protein
MDDPKNNIAEYSHKTLSAIRLLFNNQLYDHCLILIYSSIDVFGLLDAEDNVTSATRSTFKSWARNYMKLEQLNITDTDVYAARCSVLHTHTTQSDLSSSRQAKELIYLLGNKENSQIQKIKDDPRIGETHQYVFFDELVSALSSGMADFMESIVQTNPVLIERTKSLLRANHL